MTDLLRALVLGIVQGATEFLPVSSSAHLVLVPNALGWERPGLAFDVLLHFGTALAIIVFYRRELWRMTLGMLGRGDPVAGRIERRLVGHLALASVPIAIAGALLHDRIEDVFAPQIAATMLVVTAVVLLGGEQLRTRRATRAGIGQAGSAVVDPAWTAGEAEEPSEGTPRPMEDGRDPYDPLGRTLAELRPRDAVVIGIGQALALVPGLSRSGSTITAGMVAGLNRPAAARFAFLLALPAILGATVVSIPDLGEGSGIGVGELAVGVTAAFVSGYLAVSYLVRLVARAGLRGFAIYLVAASALSWLAIATGAMA